MLDFKIMLIFSFYCNQKKYAESRTARSKEVQNVHDLLMKNFNFYWLESSRNIPIERTIAD